MARDHANTKKDLMHVYEIYGTKKDLMHIYEIYGTKKDLFIYCT